MLSFVWRKFSSVGREEWCNKMKNGQKLKLGDVPWTPQEISKKYKRQSLGMPEAPPLHQQKSTRSFFNTLYFYCFIYYVLFLERLSFCFLFYFVLFAVINGWIPSIFVLEKTHSVLIAKNTLVLFLLFYECSIFLVMRLALVFHSYFVQSLFVFFGKVWFSSLIFIDYYLWELFRISWLVLETSKMFHVYSDAKGSLFRLWHWLWLVMLDVIFIICLIVIVVAWLVSNSWECLMCHWKNHVLFLFYKAYYCGILLWCFIGLTWRMLISCFDYTSHLKPLWSFSFWLVISLYALINNVLSLCMIMAIIALLVGRFQSFASLHL